MVGHLCLGLPPAVSVILAGQDDALDPTPSLGCDVELLGNVFARAHNTHVFARCFYQVAVLEVIQLLWSDFRLSDVGTCVAWFGDGPQPLDEGLLALELLGDLVPPVVLASVCWVEVLVDGASVAH